MLTSPRGIALVVAIVLAMTFLVLADEAREKEYFDFDHSVHARVQSWRQPAFEAPMRTLSALGSGKVMIPFVVAMTALLWWRGYRNAFMVPAAGIAAVAIEALAKWLVDRPRPKHVGYGFPSGHVMGTVVIFGLLVYIAWKVKLRRGWCYALTGVAVVLVVGIAFSRIYLNAHWLSDVLGAAAGGGAFLIGAILYRGERLCALDAVAPPETGRPVRT